MVEEMMEIMMKVDQVRKMENLTIYVNIYLQFHMVVMCIKRNKKNAKHKRIRDEFYRG